MEVLPPALVQLPLVADRPERGDAAANRLRILAAAHRLLAEHGPAGVSMDAVAAAAGVGKGTVFRRFGDRAGLMEALIDGSMRDFQDAFIAGPPPLGPGAPPAERLEAFLVGLVRMQREHLPAALGAELAARRGGRRVYGVLFVHARTLVQAIDPTLEAEIVATMLLGAVAPPVLDSLPDHLRADTEATLSSVRALLRGLAARTKGA